MGMKNALAAIAFLAFSHVAAAQQAPSPAAKVEDVAWLQGYWEGEGMGGRIEDMWMPPRDGTSREEVLRFKRRAL